MNVLPRQYDNAGSIIPSTLSRVCMINMYNMGIIGSEIRG
jgi:hypothetical protein